MARVQRTHHSRWGCRAPFRGPTEPYRFARILSVIEIIVRATVTGQSVVTLTHKERRLVMSLQHLEDLPNDSGLDSEPYLCNHKLLGHPALELENLGRVLLSLPKNQVKCSSGLVRNGEDFENAYRQRSNGLSLEDTIESIRTSDSYIMVRSPQIDSSFAPLYRELFADVTALSRRSGLGDLMDDAMLYLFIASPNSVTPFHIDRNSTFLLQFRGSKQITVFPQWDTRVVTDENREAYVAEENTKLPWRDDMERFGRCFEFAPGQALHIPFIAGHHVRNGSADVSISMSIIFNTARSKKWLSALQFNHRLRKSFGALGLNPNGVGRSPWMDSVKSVARRGARKMAPVGRLVNR